MTGVVRVSESQGHSRGRPQPSRNRGFLSFWEDNGCPRATSEGRHLGAAGDPCSRGADMEIPTGATLFRGMQPSLARLPASLFQFQQPEEAGIGIAPTLFRWGIGIDVGRYVDFHRNSTQRPGLQPL